MGTGIKISTNQIAQRFAYDTQGRLEYIGETIPRRQSRQGGAVWRIRKITYVNESSEDMICICWAEHSAAYKFVWSKRKLYSYS